MDYPECPVCKKKYFIPQASLKAPRIKCICVHCHNRWDVDNTKNEPKVDEKTAIENAKPPINEPQKKPFIGWLVVNDEHTDMQTHRLQLGLNLVGRKSSTMPCDVMIVTEDKYMSRQHFYIEITPARGGGYNYKLYDCNATNHTYILKPHGAMKLDKDMVLHLSDNDIIQAGKTKIVFRNEQSNANLNDIQNETRNQKFGHTVIFSK